MINILDKNDSAWHEHMLGYLSADKIWEANSFPRAKLEKK